MISVCLASFNGERYIRQQIDSILASPKVSELIVSDDGSTDETMKIVSSIADSRIKLLKGPGKGLIKNFEFLLQQAKGDYIFLSDQDDVWLEQKVDVTLDYLKSVDLVVSDCRIIDSQGRVLSDSFFSIRNSSSGVFKNLVRNSFLGCCMAFRRSVLTRALPFPEHIPMHDWWLGLLANLTGRVAFVDSALVLYRRHGANASDTAGRSSASRVKQLVWRASLSWLLMRRYVELKFR